MPNSNRLSSYRLKSKFAELPAILRHKLEAMPMADGEAPYSGGCVVKSGPGGALPFARLIFAALTPVDISPLAYVHYEQGGFTHLYYVACYDVEAAADEPLWRQVVPEALEDIHALEEIVEAQVDQQMQKQNPET